MSVSLARNVVLGVPLLLTAVAFGRAPNARRMAAVLGTIIAVTGVLAANLIAVRASWWSFAPTDSVFLGVPMEVVLGWALLWGALPALVPAPAWAWLGGFLWVDVVAMGHLAPLVILGDGWVWGEALSIGVAAAPAVTLAALSRNRSRLNVRVAIQLLGFGGTIMWLVPTVAFTLGDGSWVAVLDRPAGVRTAALIVAVVISVLPLAAVVEVARVGRGTPWPWDPPERLVTTGPYAYLANPMQVGMVLLLGLLGLLSAMAGSWALAGGTVCAVAFSASLAEPHERAVLSRRWPEWTAYREQVRDWVPRSSPYAVRPATLYLSRTCGQCSDAELMLRSLHPTALEFRAAEEAPVALTRARWVGDGHHDRGVAAVARGLEHVGLGWAWLGWGMRLPGVVQILQLVLDAFGAGPRALPTGDVERAS